MTTILEQLQDDLYNGRVDEVRADTENALRDSISASVVLNQGLISGMEQVGKDFKQGTLFIPEVLLSANAMHAGLEVLRPLLAQSEHQPMGKVVIGTVVGDLHDLGKNLVSMMLQGAGFEVVDLGIDVSPESFVEAVSTRGADLLGMSALLTTTMPAMKRTIEGLEKSGLRNQVKVLVGGAPVTPDFAKKIGADAFAPDAVTAVDVARELIG